MSSAALHHPENPFKQKKWVGATEGLQSTKRKKSKGSRSQPWLMGDDSSTTTSFSFISWLLMKVFLRQEKDGKILKKLLKGMAQLGTLVAEKDVASHYKFSGPIENLQISGGKSLFSLEVK